VNLEFFFFFTFRKKWAGRAMGNGTFNWDGLLMVMNFEISNELMKVELPPRKIWKADFSSVRPSSARRVNRHLTQQGGIMLRETGNAQLRGTCFRHSAVLSFPVTLLRKLSNLTARRKRQMTM